MAHRLGTKTSSKKAPVKRGSPKSEIRKASTRTLGKSIRTSRKNSARAA